MKYTLLSIGATGRPGRRKGGLTSGPTVGQDALGICLIVGNVGIGRNKESNGGIAQDVSVLDDIVWLGVLAGVFGRNFFWEIFLEREF